MPTMRKVFSSHIDEIGYDEKAGELHVIFSPKGRKPKATVVYQGVSPDTAKKVMGSASIGEALHQYVRGKHSHGSK